MIYIIPLILFAIFTNNKHNKAFAFTLSFIYFLYSIIPANLLGFIWYPFCIAGEISVITLALSLSIKRKFFISILSIFAISFNFLAAANYLGHGNFFYQVYPYLIQLIQAGQVLAVITIDIELEKIWRIGLYRLRTLLE